MDATLKLDGGKDIKVLQLDFGFTQYTDDTGKPTGFPTGGTINMVVESTTDTQLIDWMIGPDAKKSGTVVITVKTSQKKIEFKNGYCIQYNESFSHTGGEEPISISFTVSAESIKIDGITWEAYRKT